MYLEPARLRVEIGRLDGIPVRKHRDVRFRRDVPVSSRGEMFGAAGEGEEEKKKAAVTETHLQSESQFVHAIHQENTLLVLRHVSQTNHSYG